MFRTISLQQQDEQQGSGPRVLIVGAGIAGVTVAQLLRRAGLRPVLVERGHDRGHPGYMLALMPMVDPALDELGVRNAYRAASVPLSRYGLYGHTGRRLRVDSMSAILDRYGDYRGISRGDLLEVLTRDGCDVTPGTTVTALAEAPDTVRVTLSSPDGPADLDFDLVIVCDGLHSTTRDLIRPRLAVQTVDTHWAGWVAWAPSDQEPDLGEELWGAGFFLGVYPVAGRYGAILGGPVDDLRAGPVAFADSVRRRLREVSPRTDRVLNAIATDASPYYWPLTDCRAERWTTGRIVLLGDAGAGFLPTAGIGAGMAMESAWVLGRMIIDGRELAVPDLLTRYEIAQRPRVEAAQDNSRTLARMMFRRSRLLAVVRDTAARMLSVQAVLKPIQGLLATAPDPGRALRENSSATVRGR
ncbi:FAD-dependent oxidoreductase [Microlunatus parietis]|uniref:2-polyprenyl-6-methoxyphenol hydroxylase-like FAD-dependent oxidoreductase n=1 Tax=Microlunatus parietis TaxID=682979 RepID=A0A7Y9LDH3_9ACTN|nr:NAD(P)/FAD-dependent oxidoreductase [Microlunatus parietis]NYE71941.1 2-polyprenyl-6-methoxyphenol hydroxylase-like FAD-dependent oxidoreductase [Microlunatus parietis]